MHTNFRLIDANALLEELKKKQSERPDSPEDFADYGFWIMKKVIQSAHTVETTDDVMKRLPKKYVKRTLSVEYVGSRWIAGYKREDCAFDGYEYGKTILEAITRLEASLNPK